MGFIICFLAAVPIALIIYWFLWRLSRRYLLKSMPSLVADIAILTSSIGANIACLAYGVYRPLTGGLGIGTSERIHRGWPFPWYGLVDLEVILVTFTFAITTLFWSIVACAALCAVNRLIPSRTYPLLRYLIIAATTIGVITAAYFIPFWIGPISSL